MKTASQKSPLLILAVLPFLLLGSDSNSTPARPAEANPLFQDSGTQVVARVYFEDLEDLNLLAASLDVWEVDHAAGFLVALLSQASFQELQAAGYRVEIDPVKTGRIAQSLEPLPLQESGVPGYPCYRTVEETYADLAQLAVDHPEQATWVDIGDSWEKATPGGAAGYDLQGLVLTNQAIPGPKPVFFLMGAIHAREMVTAEMATRFAEWLVANYGVDPDATWLLDYYELHIVPQANPDGRKIAETSTLWRKNTDSDDGCPFPNQRGTDLNRNSSFHWGGAGSSSNACSEIYRGPGAASEPETQAIQDYVSAIFPDQRGAGDDDPAPADSSGVFITLHSYSQLVLFPWGWGAQPAPNDTHLETLGRKFGYFNNYTVCQSGEPGCIYLASGSTDDWAYGELGVAAYTFELGTEFFQSCATFEDTLLPGNMEALLYAFKAARRPYQDPAGPETVDLQLSGDPVAPGVPVLLTATADDSRYDSNGWGEEPVQDIAAARYSLDTPSWSGEAATQALEPADGAFDSPVESLQAQIDTASLAPGRHTIFVESQDAQGHWGVPSAAFLTIQPLDYMPGLSPTSATLEGDPGQTLTTTLLVSNLGLLEDTIDIQAGGFLWPATWSPDPLGPLGSGQSAELQVQVTIPPDAGFDDQDTLTLTAVSAGDSARSATATLTTTVRSPYQLLLEPDFTARSALPGSLVEYVLELHNTGTLADTYELSLGEHAWETEVEAELGLVQPGESVTLAITVEIPAGAPDLASDTLLVTLTSQSNPLRSASATLQTTARWHTQFLPLMRNQ